jgi:hypothetical protein
VIRRSPSLGLTSSATKWQIIAAFTDLTSCCKGTGLSGRGILRAPMNALDAPHRMQLVSRMVDAPQLQARLQRILEGCQAARPHEVLIGMCLEPARR